jgi:hypothetical protein
MEVAGGPVFSLQRGIKTKVTDVNVKPREPVLFCGLAAKEITALRPDTLTFSQQVRHGTRSSWLWPLTSHAGIVCWPFPNAQGGLLRPRVTNQLFVQCA